MIYVRLFYFNLESFNFNYGERKKRELKIQLAKLFGNIIQNGDNNNKKNDNENNNINTNENEIIDNIENNTLFYEK